MRDYNGFSSNLRTRAQRWLDREWRAGRLERPTQCAACGQTEGVVQAHAEDYSEPFRRGVTDGFHLCLICHAMVHARHLNEYAWREYRRVVEAGGRAKVTGKNQTFIGAMAQFTKRPMTDGMFDWAKPPPRKILLEIESSQDASARGIRSGALPDSEPDFSDRSDARNQEAEMHVSETGRASFVVDVTEFADLLASGPRSGKLNEDWIRCYADKNPRRLSAGVKDARTAFNRFLNPNYLLRLSGDLAASGALPSELHDRARKLVESVRPMPDGRQNFAGGAAAFRRIIPFETMVSALRAYRPEATHRDVPASASARA